MSFEVERAASLLVEAHQQHRLVVPFAPGPAKIADAYAVQDAVARRLGAVGGWKVGAKGLGETPNVAPLLAALIGTAPAQRPSSSFHMIGVEAELAFRLAEDVKPRSGPLAREAIWAAVESVHAAIEIVDTRLADWQRADKLWVLADNQSNGGFVYDPNGVPFEDRSFATVPVQLRIDGHVVVDRTGGNPAGDPRWLVEWLVNHCVQYRGGLHAGMVVTTGSYTGMLFLDRSASVEAVFEGIGSVEVRFA